MFFLQMYMFFVSKTNKEAFFVFSITLINFATQNKSQY